MKRRLRHYVTTCLQTGIPMRAPCGCSLGLLTHVCSDGWKTVPAMRLSDANRAMAARQWNGREALGVCVCVCVCVSWLVCCLPLLQINCSCNAAHVISQTSSYSSCACSLQMRYACSRQVVSLIKSQSHRYRPLHSKALIKCRSGLGWLVVGWWSV